jgi:hypothetical protein
MESEAPRRLEVDASESFRGVPCGPLPRTPSPKLGRGLLVCGRMAHIDSIILSSLSGKVPTE